SDALQDSDDDVADVPAIVVMTQARQSSDGFAQDNRVAGCGDRASGEVGKYITCPKVEAAVHPLGERQEDPGKADRLAVPPPVHRITRQRAQRPSEPLHVVMVCGIHLLSPAGEFFKRALVSGSALAKAAPEAVRLILRRLPLALREHGDSSLNGSEQVSRTRI